MNALVVCWSVLRASLFLDGEAMHRLALVDSGSWPAAIAILVLAGLSFSAGRSVVMLINRASRGSMLWRSALNAVFLPGVVLVGSAAVTTPPMNAVVVAAFVAAPLTLSVFSIVPYIGTGLNRLLGVWAFVIVLDFMLSVTRFGP